MIDVLVDTILDTVKTIPFLFVIYLLLEYFQSKAKHMYLPVRKLNKVGPFIGGTLGCIPQCGFSAAAATLYNEKAIKGGTLIAVFLATSDEAIPVLLGSSGRFQLVLAVIGVKLIIGIAIGYILNATVFRYEELSAAKPVEVEFLSCESDRHHKHKGYITQNALSHTIKISIFILVTLLIINSAVYLLGEERFSALLLSGNVLQPLITALIGLVPGCSVSVLITQLFMNGDLSFGSALAGLSTGAGFGYVILAKKSSLRKTLTIVFTMYVVGVLCGLLLNWIG